MGKITTDRTPHTCDICNRVCQGLRALKSHKIQKHERAGTPRAYKGVMRKSPSKPAWNKGLTKSTDVRVKRNGDNSKHTTALKKQLGTWQRAPLTVNKGHRQRLSERQSTNNTGGKCTWFEVDGVKVQGTWERNLAVKFNELGIVWIKPRRVDEIWKYNIDDKIKSYTPDFYLPEYDTYLEVKGYWWGDDRRKMDIIIAKYPERKIFIVELEQYQQIMDGELVWLF
jgi:hypothetical protein